MKQYVGTKCVAAIPMTRGEYNAYRHWTIPDDEDPADPGYLVEYLDGGAPNDERHTGYISWSPVVAFDAAYRASGQMNFGHALEMLNRGHAVERAGWNGKGMFIYRVGAGNYPAASPVAKAHWGEEAFIPYRPYLAIKSVDGTVAPWLPSQTDVLADDWAVVAVEG